MFSYKLLIKAATTARYHNLGNISVINVFFLFTQQVSSKLAGRCQPGPRKAASSSMVCLHPGAVTFSCVRSMNCLPSSHHSEYTIIATHCNTAAGSCYSANWCCSSLTSLYPSPGCTCMAFARLGGDFCQAQHLLLIVDK